MKISITLQPGQRVQSKSGKFGRIDRLTITSAYVIWEDGLAGWLPRKSLTRAFDMNGVLGKIAKFIKER